MVSDFHQQAGNRGADEPDELRERIVAAITRVAAEEGYARFSVDSVLRAAGITRDVFERYFADREEALIAAQEAFLGGLELDALGACESEAEWPGKVSAATAAVLGSLVEVNPLARALWVEAAGANLAAAECQLVALEQFAEMLRDGRRHYPAAAAMPEITERALIGGVATVVSRCLLAEEPKALVALRPQLIELLLMPYLGGPEARRFAHG